MLSNKLTSKAVEHAKPGRHVDGGGLQLLVKPSGAKSWVLRVQVSGVRRDYGLGSVADMSLAEARDKATEGRKLAKQGIDPARHWSAQRATIPTFEAAARDCHESMAGGWKNPKHAAQWLSTLSTYAFPTIGKIGVDKVGTTEVVDLLKPIWLEKPETARRVRQRVCFVIDYAVSKEWRSDELQLRALVRGLPSQKQARARYGHFSAMPYSDVPALMAKLRGDDATVGRLALRFAILTAARSGEVRFATVAELDMKKALWMLPASKMKAGKPHVVPLTGEALAIVETALSLDLFNPDGLLFPGNRGKPISDATMLKALRVASGGRETVHGMRSSFKDFAVECCPDLPDAVSEVALSHTDENRVRAAYRRSTFDEMRRDLATRWESYLKGEQC